MTELEITNLDIPSHYIPKLKYIIQSGVLDLRNDKGVLHFDAQNNLKIIEYPHRYLPPS